MSDQNLKAYQININGNRLQISSPYGEEHISEVEQFLDDKISEINEQSNVLGPTNLAFLVALNMADELLNLRNRQSNYDDVEESLSHLCDRLENVLTSSGMVGSDRITSPDFSAKF